METLLTRGDAGSRRGVRYPGSHHGRRLGSPRAALGLGAEASALHRLRARCRGAVARPGPGRVAAGVPGHLRDRAPEPGPADPLRDPERAPRRPRRALLRAVDRPRGGHAPRGHAAVLGRHPPLRRRVRRARLQPLGRARLHERPQLPRPGRRARAGRRPHRRATRWSGAGGHATYNPEPLADFLDFVVLGDGEEVVGEINEAVAAWIAGGRAERRRRPAGAGRHRGRVRPGALRGPLPARRPPRGHRADRPGRAAGGREAHHRRPGRLALPEAAARAAHRGGPRPPQRRGVPRAAPAAAASARPG